MGSLLPSLPAGCLAAPLWLEGPAERPGFPLPCGVPGGLALVGGSGRSCVPSRQGGGSPPARWV